MYQRTKIALALLLLTAPLAAQQELGLNLMHHVWQSNYTNPAIVQPERFVFAGLGFRNNLVFDGPTYNQIVTRKDGKPVIDIERFIGYLEPENTVRDDLDFSTLNFAFRLGNLTLSAGHAVKYHAFIRYPKTLPQVVWQGNAQFIGETVDLSNDLQLTGYHELAFGAAWKMGNLTLGAKGKFLNGIADVTTHSKHRNASLYTDPDVYQITLNGDYILHTANSIDYESYKDLNADFNFGSLTLDKFFSRNAGFAFDLGARLELGKLDLTASVLDIGAIQWDHNVTNYLALQSYQYDGLDFSQALTGGDVSFGDALDTLEQLFRVEKTGDAYSNSLPRKIYLGATWQLNDAWRVGGVFFNENFRGESATAVAVGANVALFKFLDLGATYAVKQNRSFDNFGLNLTLALGPFRLFGVTDNVFALVEPGNSKNFTARFGAAFLIE